MPTGSNRPAKKAHPNGRGPRPENLNLQPERRHASSTIKRAVELTGPMQITFATMVGNNSLK
jgi:hypothetical protein